MAKKSTFYFVWKESFEIYYDRLSVCPSNFFSILGLLLIYHFVTFLSKKWGKLFS